MTPRGLTLIEVLTSLALLGLLAAALSSWLQLTSAFSSRAAAMLPWEAAAEQALQRIHEDLLVGDFVQQEKDAKEPRCNVIDGVLTIRTRDSLRGTVLHSSGGGGRLEQVTRSASEKTETRLLVGDVAAWTCEFDSKARHLTVSLTSSEGAAIKRSFACPQ